jgi:hypothetical protein
LLSSLPLTNHRTDRYGGVSRTAVATRQLRHPCGWPAVKPISVRISAHDWAPGGTNPVDAVAIARLFKAAGADLLDCSSGHVVDHAQPVYGRMYQTPFADRIRNEAGIATIAVGAIYEADHANSIIAAGRADLCAIARPHLANPAWTLNEAAKIGYPDIEWPRQYRNAKQQLERNIEREKQLAAANRRPHATANCGTIARGLIGGEERIGRGAWSTDYRKRSDALTEAHCTRVNQRRHSMEILQPPTWPRPEVTRGIAATGRMVFVSE